MSIAVQFGSLWRRSVFNRTGHNSLRWIIGASSIVLAVFAWYLVTGPLALLTALQFPSPAGAYDSLLRLIRPGYAGATLINHILSSVELVVLGFVAAIATGVPFGLLMGRNRMMDAYINPIFQIIRPIAPIAWIPLTIVWFGLGMDAKVFVVWLAAFAPALINTYTGARNIDSTVIDAAKVHGGSGWRLLMDVVIPGALPAIFTGLRISLQACWMVLVAAELVGSFTGLGHIMIIATRDLNSGMIFVAMVWVAVLGVLMTILLSKAEWWLMPWLR